MIKACDVSPREGGEAACMTRAVDAYCQKETRNDKNTCVCVCV